MPITMTTPPTVIPVTVDEVKRHLVIDQMFWDDDALIEMYIKAATEYGQNLTGRQFVQASFQLDIDEFPVQNIMLAPNLQTVTSIRYAASDGTVITLDSEGYDVKTTALVGFIRPVTSWPADSQNIIVDFDAGWPVVNDASTTPQSIKQWIMVRVAGMYEQRENFVLSKAGSFAASPMPADFIDHMLNCYKVPGFGAGV